MEGDRHEDDGVNDWLLLVLLLLLMLLREEGRGEGELDKRRVAASRRGEEENRVSSVLDLVVLRPSGDCAFIGRGADVIVG